MEDLQKTLKTLPHTPGVYLYHNASDDVIYVGKAKDLSRRVKQYFQKGDAVGDKTRRLVSEIARIEIITVTSEFDALLLEAKLIRSYMPKYNVISRDDKSSLYIGMTLSEELPHIRFVRKGQIAELLTKRKNVIYGPFQSAHAVRIILRQVRNAVPYCMQNERNGRPCFYTHLGLCSPCPSVIAKMSDADGRRKLIRLYRKNIYQLKALFDGKTAEVRRQYEARMKLAARALRFEEAGDLKKRIDALYSIAEYRYDPAIFLERGAQDVYEDELEELTAVLRIFYPDLTDLTRIECFDMSQLFGTNAVGSMVVLVDGKPDTHEYRRFRIRDKGTISDTSMMAEVLARRFKHTDWPMPQFILIDGGKPQLAITYEVMKKADIQIPYAGLAKRQEELIIPLPDGRYKTVRLPLSGKALKVLQRVRDEAHRFAISYHRLLRGKSVMAV